MEYILILIPVIGGISGWFTAALALKVLFRPADPMKLPFTDTHIRGLLPGKQEHLAAGVREIIQTQLQLAVTEDSGPAYEVRANLSNTIVVSIKEHIQHKIPFLVPRGVRQKIIDTIEDIVRKEIAGFLDELVYSVRQDRGAGSDLCRFIEEKIRCYDLADLETRVKKLPEIFYLKIAAALIGVAAGLLQILVAVVAGT
ncbi:hypothetical protein [Phosphitispora fastidiosa]|uniref:hypothetical protein n=1 Tax=Phosphitispora fastidiosa TaxID=2837202 RepID=UPI001E4CC018|nr:hypothetical protein [Phosphitispora fastidiosa]MBU7007125.1 uncharacterized membrane protein YheB (UPF0754 family) [Phosphitispora fastidiosa]